MSSAWKNIQYFRERRKKKKKMKKATLNQHSTKIDIKSTAVSILLRIAFFSPIPSIRELASIPLGEDKFLLQTESLKAGFPTEGLFISYVRSRRGRERERERERGEHTGMERGEKGEWVNKSFSKSFLSS